MAELNETVSKLKDLDEKLSSLPTEGLGDLALELQNIKETLPATSIKEMAEKLSQIEAKLDKELKKKHGLSKAEVIRTFCLKSIDDALLMQINVIDFLGKVKHSSSGLRKDGYNKEIIL